MTNKEVDIVEDINERIVRDIGRLRNLRRMGMEINGKDYELILTSEHFLYKAHHLLNDNLRGRRKCHLPEEKPND